MAYTQQAFRAAMAVLDDRRTHAEADARRFRGEMIAQYPRLAEIEKQVGSAALQVAKAILSGGDVDKTVAAIQEENLALQEEMATLLAKAGQTRRNFDPVYTCPVCGDTGYADGKLCECLKTLLRQDACQKLSRMAAMELTSFDTMSLEVYPAELDPRLGRSPREWMRGVLEYGRRYAEGFSAESPNLLLTGPTGVGKTHMVLAIAKAAIDRDFEVVYGPAGTLLGRLEKEHFGRAEGDSERVFLECDLLVLDDLGTEFAGPFNTACLYNLVNSRLLSGKPTIISTNLGRSELVDRYGEQTASRILGNYEALSFFGQDIRQIKARQRMRG